MNADHIKIQEDRFCGRLAENLAAVAGGGAVERSDCVADLRRLTGGTLLRGQLEGRYPLGRALWVRLGGKGGLFAKRADAVVLKGLSLIRLERLVQDGGDDEPMDVGRLNAVLSEQADWSKRNVCRMVAGLFSPTGWTDEAAAFIRNDPPGSGWASAVVHPILIGPAITDLAWDRSSDVLRQYVQCFCGLTAAERQKVCSDYLQRRLLVDEFAHLQTAADELGLDLATVKAVAAEIAKDGKRYAVTTISGVGLVIKKKL